MSAFLDKAEDRQRPADNEIRDWVRRSLGKHKSPTHVFWLGEGGVPAEVPLTGSGKVRKFEMAKLGDELLKRRNKNEGLVAAKL